MIARMGERVCFNWLVWWGVGNCTVLTLFVDLPLSEIEAQGLSSSTPVEVPMFTCSFPQLTVQYFFLFVYLLIQENLNGGGQ